MELPRDCISSGVASLDDISNVLAEHALHNAGEYSFHLNELLTIFPTLQDGLDVNPKFTRGVSGMEYTSQLTAFEILQIQIVHGWLLDPQDQDMMKLIGNRTYNELVELVIAGKDAEIHLDTVQDEISVFQQQYEALSRGRVVDDPNAEVVNPETTAPAAIAPNLMTPNVTESVDGNDQHSVEDPPCGLPKPIVLNAEAVSDVLREKTTLLKKLEEEATTGTLIDNFLQSTCHQLTTYGLMELYKHVEPDSLCVFFRNNHFCSMTKHDGVLYLLVTDLGYANVADIMWEKLDAIDGDTEYMTPTFAKSTPHSDLLPPPSGPSPETMLAQRAQNDYDFQVALELSKGSAAVNQTDQDPDLAAAKQASLLDFNGMDGISGVGSFSQEEADRLAAEELQAQFGGPSPEEASIALARKLQEEEYQQADSNRRTSNTRRNAASSQQAEKSNCVVS